MGVKIIAHQVQNRTEHLMPGPGLYELGARGMNCGFSRGQGEDQPALPDIDGEETENITKKGSICIGIPAVKENVRANDHAAEYSPAPGAVVDLFRTRL